MARATPLLLVAVLASTVAMASPARGPAAGPFPVLAPVPFTGDPVPPEDPDHFTFFLVGDSRPDKADQPFPSVLDTFFLRLQASKAAFVLWTGDAIVGKNPGDTGQVACQYSAFINLATGRHPIFMAPGNHEADDEEDEPNQAMQDLYVSTIGALYGAFDYGHSHFVALNTDELTQTGAGPPEATLEGLDKTKPRGHVSQAQIDLLKQDLEAHKDAAHIFVFMHRPIKAKKESAALEATAAAAIEALLKGYPNVCYVFASHEHLYYNPQDPGNLKTPPQWPDPKGAQPLYLVSGGGGAPLKGKPSEGGFYHYLVFKVDGEKVHASLKRLEP